jgi:hypothetical protein
MTDLCSSPPRRQLSINLLMWYSQICLYTCKCKARACVRITKCIPIECSRSFSSVFLVLWQIMPLLYILNAHKCAFKLFKTFFVQYTAWPCKDPTCWVLNLYSTYKMLKLKFLFLCCLSVHFIIFSYDFPQAVYKISWLFPPSAKSLVAL